MIFNTQITGSGGGGGGEAEEKDVNFYDYDGTRVYSYTKADFLALDAMPSNPNHSGDNIPLTSKGWNWIFTNAKTYVTNYGKLEIGQMYVPTDGKTHIVIEIPENVPDAQLTYYVRCTPTVSTGVTIDWDDGNTTTTSSTRVTNYSHTYAAPGIYDITLDVTRGTVSFSGTSSNMIYGSLSNRYNTSRIQHVRIGKNVTSIGSYVFYSCYMLQSITISPDVTSIGNSAFYSCCMLQSVMIPSNVTSIGTNAFQYNIMLRAITIPYGVTSIDSYAFANCYVLKTATLPSSVTSIGTYMFQNSYMLQTVTIPSNATSIVNYMFQNGYELRSVTIPANATSINTYAFNGCYVLRSVTIPANVTSIGTYAFAGCYSLAYIRLLSTTPPTLAGTNAFNNIPTSVPFVVPNDSVTEYKGASNWSTYASRIIGESDWNPA